eukprot:jgi/Galph1/4058/GphlegSOOS_G2783.1
MWLLQSVSSKSSYILSSTLRKYCQLSKTVPHQTQPFFFTQPRCLVHTPVEKQQKEEKASYNLTMHLDSNGLGPKRFYQQAYTMERQRGTFSICLDGKTVRTRNGKVLETNCRELALVVASEWEAQQSRIRPISMPMNSLVTTAIDLTEEQRKQFIGTLLKFFETDTVCVRARYPESLVHRQQKLWNPLIDHISEKFNITIKVTEDLFGVSQPSESITKLYNYLEKQNSLFLTALYSATCTSKSLIIGLALSEKLLDASSAMQCSRCEEDFQCEWWGEVKGGHDIDRADVHVRLAAASFLFSLLRAFPEKLFP